MGKHVDKVKQSQTPELKKQNIEAEIKMSKVVKELTEKIGNLEVAIEALNEKINEFTAKADKQNKANK